MPETAGRPIRVGFRANLHAHRGQLHTESVGEAVYAGSDIRRRVMVLDASLKLEATELRRILLHELFHFAWARLGNGTRQSWAELVAREFERRARGELGWSAEYRKNELRALKPSERHAPRWREYICESFCDTAAWFYSGIKTHPEFTLAQRHRKLRAQWFAEYFQDRAVSI